jgi:hypothetical protein
MLRGTKMVYSTFAKLIHLITQRLGPPTQGKAYKALMAAEVKTMNTSSGTVGAVHFINNGLHLERDQ